jgi:hypothetical protein
MEIPRHWRLKDQRYKLIGDVNSYGEPRFPPRGNNTTIVFSSKLPLYTSDNYKGGLGKPPQSPEQ